MNELCQFYCFQLNVIRLKVVFGFMRIYTTGSNLREEKASTLEQQISLPDIKNKINNLNRTIKKEIKI